MFVYSCISVIKNSSSKLYSLFLSAHFHHALVHCCSLGMSTREPDIGVSLFVAQLLLLLDISSSVTKFTIVLGAKAGSKHLAV